MAAIPNADQTSSQIVSRLRTFSSHETNVEAPESDRNIARANVGHVTDSARERDVKNGLNVSDAIFSSHPKQEPLVDGGAEASILAIDDGSVMCEVFSSGGAMRVSLPRSYFPEKLVFGMPMSIGVVEVEGVRQPVVRLRQQRNSNDELDSELSDLIDSL